MTLNLVCYSGLARAAISTLSALASFTFALTLGFIGRRAIARVRTIAFFRAIARVAGLAALACFGTLLILFPLPLAAFLTRECGQMPFGSGAEALVDDLRELKSRLDPLWVASSGRT